MDGAKLLRKMQEREREREMNQRERGENERDEEREREIKPTLKVEKRVGKGKNFFLSSSIFFISKEEKKVDALLNVRTGGKSNARIIPQGAFLREEQLHERKKKKL